jgi:hypothetical protein
MGLWARVRELGAGPEHRLLADVGAAYREEMRLAAQLRLHAERKLGRALLALAEEADGHAALLRAEITRLGGSATAYPAGTPRNGRNYWERLTFDLEDLRTKQKRYLELVQHWDLEQPGVAGLFGRLARDDGMMSRTVGELIARSDPHAED